MGETRSTEPEATVNAIRRAVLSLGVATALLAATNPAAGAGPVEVRISQHRFAPGTVVVQSGATVRWVNDDDDPHTVTSDTGAFASPGLDTREEFTFTFRAPGTYTYYCALHPMMKGTVVVR
jgi:plastocyanin